MDSPTCQICLETIDKNAKENALLANICGKSCTALVCRQCLGRHIDVTLQQFYAGVLPRIRCPICLVNMHISRWQDRVSDDIRQTLVKKYARLCRQTCTLTAPCCHKSTYSHLPIYNPQTVLETPIKLLPSQLTKFKTLCKQFCCHKVPPRAVLDCAFNTFGDEKAEALLNDLTLPRISDAERRATLLLSLMYLRPNTKTLCCGADFCYNCKRIGHHNSCEEEFDETKGLVRCRSCHILLLKVEGCDSLTCVCGFNMDWLAEVKFRAEHKKKLLPVDIFDRLLFDQWHAFHRHQIRIKDEMDHKRLVKFTASIKSILRPIVVIFIWRHRYRNVLTKDFKASWRARREKQFQQLFGPTKPVLAAFVTNYIWRWRFHHALIQTMQGEFYWKAYQRWHPEEVETAHEELHWMLNIAAFDE